MFLQAGNSVISTMGTEKKMFSLWEMLFSGSLTANIFLLVIFILGITSLYVFFERYFFIERASLGTPNLLENIKDCIHEGRIETAIDFCKEADSPESRMSEKGLLRIGRPITDISLAMQHQAQIETHNLKKKLNVLIFTMVLAPMIGLFGTVIGLMTVFFRAANAGDDFGSKHLISGLYNTLPTIAIGLLTGIVTCFLYYGLTSKIERVTLKIQKNESDFLDAINKPL
jgi:biopolymer transport protein ExbB